MKTIIPLSLLMLTSGAASAQFSFGTNNPNPASILDISSTTKGLLIPRMTASERTSIPSPPEGLMVYQTDNVTTPTPSAAGLYTYTGGAWLKTGGVAGSGLTDDLPNGKINLGGPLTTTALVSTAAGKDMQFTGLGNFTVGTAGTTFQSPTSINVAGAASTTIGNTVSGTTTLNSQTLNANLPSGSTDVNIVTSASGTTGTAGQLKTRTVSSLDNSIAVVTDGTSITGNGKTGNGITLNVGHSNTWTADQLLPNTSTQGNNLNAAVSASTSTMKVAGGIIKTPVGQGAGNADKGSFTTLDASGTTTLSGATTISGATTLSNSSITASAIPNSSTLGASDKLVVSNAGALETRDAGSISTALAGNGLTAASGKLNLGGTLTANVSIDGTANNKTVSILSNHSDGSGTTLNVENNIPDPGTGTAPTAAYGSTTSISYLGTSNTGSIAGLVTAASTDAHGTAGDYQIIGSDNVAAIDASAPTGDFPHAIGVSGIGNSNGSIGSSSKATVIGVSGGTGFDAGSSANSDWNGIGTEGYLDYSHGTTGVGAGGYFNGNNVDASNNPIGTSIGVIGAIGDNPSYSYESMFASALFHKHVAVAAVNNNTASTSQLALYTKGRTYMNGDLGIGTVTPKTTLQVNGSVSAAYQLINNQTSYTIDANGADYFVRFDASGATIPTSYTLPDPASCPGRILVIKNHTPGSGTSGVLGITVTGGSAVKDKLDASVTTQDANTTWTFMSDGLNWNIISAQ